MSDFINDGWSIFVAAATVLGLVACIVLLLIASRRQPSAADNTTGHIWDEDLRELNNPLPAWWMGLFVLTVVFAGIYLALYPGLGSVAYTFADASPAAVWLGSFSMLLGRLEVFSLIVVFTPAFWRD